MAMLLNKLKTVMLALVALVVVAFGGVLAVTYSTANGQPELAENESKRPSATVPAPLKAPDKVVFMIKTELAELDENGKKSIITRPQIMTVEEEPAQIQIGNPASLYPNIADACKGLTIGATFKVKVKRCVAGKAEIDLDLTNFKVEKAEKADTFIVANSIRAVKQVELGKRCRFVIAKDQHGESQLWFDMAVSEANRSTQPDPNWPHGHGSPEKPRAAPSEGNHADPGRSWPFIY